MKITNQIEHLRNLYKELRFEEVIQFGMITLPSSLDEKRYTDALICYEYIASAYFEIGCFENFLVVMKEYEKLCITYGNDHNKMVFYYLCSLSHVFGNDLEESIKATKKSIRYAHQLKRDGLIVINYCNIAAILALINQFEQAKIAMRLANYYKQNLPNVNDAIVRGSTGALFYLAIIKDSEEFYKTKQEFLQCITEKQPFYSKVILLAEALLAFNLGQVQQSNSLFEQVYQKIKVGKNKILLILINTCIEQFKLKEQFQYTNELEQFMKSMNKDLLKSANIQSVSKDVFLDNIQANTFKYPNVVSKESIIEYVDNMISQKNALYCIHWCFVTKELEDLFETQYVEQLLFPLFEKIYQSIFKYDAKVHVLSKNKGEAFIINMNEAELYALLGELEKNLHSLEIYCSTGSVKIPIHFGFIHSTKLPENQVSYDQLVAFAAAGLYYAKSHEQLYIES